MRASGEPYICHPVAVADLLRDIGASAGVIAALSARGLIRVITDSAAQYDDTRRTPKLSGWPAADAQIGDTRIESAGQIITLVNHLGISACDLAYAELLLDLAEKQNVGTLLAR